MTHHKLGLLFNLSENVRFGCLHSTLLFVNGSGLWLPMVTS